MELHHFFVPCHGVLLPCPLRSWAIWLRIWTTSSMTQSADDASDPPSSSSRRSSADYPAHSPFEALTSILPSFRSSPLPSPASSSSSIRPILREPIVVGILSGVAGISLTFGGIYGYRRFWRRIRNSDYVTTGMLERKQWIKGIVTR